MPARLDDTTPPWCFRLIAELDAADARATALAKTLSPTQLNWRPRPGTWSVGQCLEHLAAGNEVYVRAMSHSLGDRRHVVVQNITPGWFGRWFIRTYIDPAPGTRRGRAPKTIRPAADVDPSILNRFVASNDQVRDLIRRARHYDVNRLRFKNPFIPVLRFTVGTGLEILSTHERRHLLQAERIRVSSDFPG